MNLKTGSPQGFDRPTKLPTSPEERSQWQSANGEWWEAHPMRYDWRDGIPGEERSQEFFNEIDKRFFEDSRVYMPWKKVPFETLIDFDALRSKDVLEIGVGCGSHAGLLARHARSFTGIDLTNYAVRTTSERMRCFGLNAQILQMDAENLRFEDNSFDFIWSWGVIHHSSDTKAVLEQMRRVLRPGGTAVTMVYHRGLWNYYVCEGLCYGILGGDIFKTRSLHKTAQRHWDGALARFFTPKEWRELISPYFDVEDISIYGSKADLAPVPGGKLKTAAMKLLPDEISRFLTNNLKMGTFLVSTMRKR